MTKQRFRVGLVGVQPGRSWAAIAHIPALRALSNDFEILGVANTSYASAQAAATACGIPRAFTDVAELVNSPEVDIVTVAVKVPHHLELVTAAIDAGKHVYCEWPLGNGLNEAEKLAALARKGGTLGVIGTQARAAPEIEHLRQLIADGFVGEVLSTSLIGSGMVWGAEIDQPNAYVLDRANGATMLTIPFGHTMAAVQDVLGPIMELSGRLANRRTTARVVETGEVRPMTAHDQVVVGGVFANGAPISVHYRGGTPRGTGFLWEINGSEGDIQVTGAGGHAQLTQLSLRGARGPEKELRPLTVPDAAYAGWPEHVIPRNVARIYARMAADLRNSTRTAPSFDDALDLHRLIAAVEESANNGRRVVPGKL